jgi:UDP-N-acetylglucosamine 1-carboxyvinyltransferase
MPDNSLAGEERMSAFVVEGKNKLTGTIKVAGNKNEAFPCIAAALLCRRPVRLDNIPDIGDVRTMLTIVEKLGAHVSPLRNGTCTITADGRLASTLPLELSSAIRGSIVLASALLVRTGKAILPQPGGDTIGRRRLDTHMLVFKALGARVGKTHQKAGRTGPAFSYTITAPGGGLKGADIYLDEASVTATENALIAAAGARGTTVIANAASEPHVQGLCRFLVEAGVQIEGIGSNVLTVHGTDTFSCVNHRLDCDYTEAGSLIALAAATGSALTITDVDTAIMRLILFQFSRLGIKTTTDPDRRSITVADGQRLRVRQDLGGAIPRIEDAPWPGFPADLTSIMVVAATQSRGTCLIHEKMFESRLFFVDWLIGMGAQIVLCDPHRAVVVGPAPLQGATVTSPDIRAGMALLIAALAARGESMIQNIEQIDRGYENIDRRLRALGAHIERIPERRRQPRR